MNKVQHFEVPADDMSRAKKFYAAVFGWEFEDYPMPGMDYTAIYTTEVDEKTRQPKEPGAVNGGLLKRGGPWLLEAPTVAVVVPDLAQALKKIKAAGGSVVMEPVDVGGMGRYAYIRDTERNVIGVWQNVKMPAAKKTQSKPAAKKSGAARRK
jgi:predicted enzyme related to lactoylglutathione lyase